jgi:dipeptidyl aminopeptidase/acylaminoacyl peptidase
MKLTVAMIMGNFKGKFDGDSVVGTWSQSGAKLPLVLKKSENIAELVRPQTPQPPFPYLEKEVSYINPESGFKMTGSLTLPKVKEKVPAVVLISGSGAQDRDESLFGHKPFWVIADYLTRNGIAVLRVDDRGIGGSEGKTSDATSIDFAGDVIASFRFLQTQPEIDPQKIGLTGHSEGGLIAPIVAGKNVDVAFVVLLAGPALPGEQIVYEQQKLILLQSGMSEEQANEARLSQEEIFTVLKTETDSAKRNEKLKEIMSNGMYNLMNDELKTSIDNQVKTVDNKWFRFFLTYDPYPALTKLTCPVLALNGEKDLQVPPQSNLPLIEKALKEARNENFKIMEVPGVNHLFQTCKTGAVTEYAEIEETISPSVLEILKDWIVNSGLKK